MIIIKRFGNQTDAACARIEQDEVHGKYCAQVYYSGQKGPWFGWSDDLGKVEIWAQAKLESIEFSEEYLK